MFLRHTLATAVAVCLSVTTLSALPGTPGDDEFVGIESTDITIGENAKQRYFLIGKEGARSPKKGFKLALVLPGGGGGADFNPFIKRIFANALGEDYVVAQLVAPVWNPNQAKNLVWPIEKNRASGMEFSTEEFIGAVIADVEERKPIDPSFIFTLAWSSGGPAAYAYSVHDDSRVTGTFVAMSVFKPDQMDSLKAAKGYPYFLLHSPTDFIPMSHPEMAVERLGKKKAKVELRTYEGGHGWHGDVFGNLRAGFSYLEKHHGKAKKVKSRRRR